MNEQRICLPPVQATPEQITQTLFPQPFKLVQDGLPRSNKNNSPFRYPGGKFYARRMILDVIPPHVDYCEPFAGGASIFFAKERAIRLSTLNDMDSDVINTLTQIRDNVESLIELLDGIKATKKNYAFYKNCYEPSNKLERAFRWYYLNRTSYSGIMRPENCYWGFGRKYSMCPENWPPHLRTVSEKLQGVRLMSRDFEKVIDKLPDGCFAFVDPPYYNADQQKFYKHTFSLDDHKRMLKCLRRNSSRLSFLLTYDNHPDIKAMYSWVKVIRDREWNYTINRTDDQKNGFKLKDGFRQSRYKGREVFIMNYDAR